MSERTSTGASVSHSYAAVGTYTTTVTATAVDGAKTSATANVVVSAALQASITGLPVSGQSNSGVAVTTTAQVSGGADLSSLLLETPRFDV